MGLQNGGRWKARGRYSSTVVSSGLTVVSFLHNLQRKWQLHSFLINENVKLKWI